MIEADLLTTYPRLWHMAEDGSWGSIQKQGLLSASALVSLYQLDTARTDQILRYRRPHSITIERDGLPSAVIRDQKPMSDAALEKCLTGDLTPSQWYSTLNSKVFFWLSKQRLRRLLGARAYRSQPQIVLTLCTASLVAANRKKVSLCSINSGSTIMNPRPRGNDSFMSIEDYPFADWCKRRPRKDAVVELTVDEGVVLITQHVLTVHRVQQEEATEIWRSPMADADDGP